MTGSNRSRQTPSNSIAAQNTLVSPSCVTEALSLTPSSPPQTSPLRHHLETSSGALGMSEHGVAGPLELPSPPRPIPIRRPLPRPNLTRRPPRSIPIHRPLPRPNLIPKATPVYPDSSATSQAHILLNLNHPARRGNKRRAGKGVHFSLHGRKVGAAQASARPRNAASAGSYAAYCALNVCQEARQCRT